jgi:hypothetical protein
MVAAIQLPPAILDPRGDMSVTRFWALQLAAFLVGSLTFASAQAPRPSSPNYSGMYAFLREGEFVQITVEGKGRVTGFVSRFGDSDSDRGTFLDHFFKSGTINDNQLTFTTELVHGVSFDFQGMIERGPGKNPGDEGYYILKGKLTETTSDEANKTASHSREVVFKSFPQDLTR